MFSSIEDTEHFRPLLTSTRLLLKCENMQKTGSFKLRGIAVQMDKVAKECQGKRCIMSF